ncbi:MAG TPA: response regulator [Chitinophagales bacterium]|nr:response regulator [Chitinophagales bacterium]
MQDRICLLIDDDEDDQYIFGLALEDADKTYKCITVSNGIDALKKLNGDPAFIPDFIFLDLNMPYMGGKQCLQEIKKIPRLSHVPIVIYTTSSYEKDINEAKQLGAAHFLIKPPDIGILSQILSVLLKNQPLSFSLNQGV